MYYICTSRSPNSTDRQQRCAAKPRESVHAHTTNLPTSTHNLPTKICCLKLSGNFPMGMRIPPLDVKIMLESNPLKSRILVRRLAVRRCRKRPFVTCRDNYLESNMFNKETCFSRASLAVMPKLMSAPASLPDERRAAHHWPVRKT